MAEYRALWKSRCSRCVLDLRGIIWLNIWQHFGPFPSGVERILVFQVDDLAQRCVAAYRLVCNFSHRVTPKLINHK